MDRRSAGTAMRGAQFVDPSALARMGNLELVARTVVDGFINGLHRAPHMGSRSTSPSTVGTSPATTCAAWTGVCLPGPIAST